MNGFEQINAITNLHRNALKNINLDAMKNIYSDPLGKMIPDMIRGYDLGMANTFADSMRNLIPDMLKPYDSNVVSTYADQLRKMIPDAIRGYDLGMANTFADSMRNLIPNAIGGFGLGSVNTFTDTVKKLIPDMLKVYDSNVASAYADTIKNIDFSLLSNVNFDSIKRMNSAITRTVNDLSEKSEFDDSDYENVNNISNYALEMTFSDNLPVSVRKNVLFNIVQNLWKLMGIQQFSFLLAVISIVLSFLQPPNVAEKIIIKETIREIIIIEQEHKELNLRGIINDGTKLYKKPNTKSTTIFTLDCGDIVEVLKINKKWVYIRLYKTDIEGWVLKKYTKGSKSRKHHYVNI
jgi:hypothetical protein